MLKIHVIVVKLSKKVICVSKTALVPVPAIVKRKRQRLENVNITMKMHFHLSCILTHFPSLPFRQYVRITRVRYVTRVPHRSLSAARPFLVSSLIFSKPLFPSHYSVFRSYLPASLISADEVYYSPLPVREIARYQASLTLAPDESVVTVRISISYIHFLTRVKKQSSYTERLCYWFSVFFFFFSRKWWNFEKNGRGTIFNVLTTYFNFLYLRHCLRNEGDLSFFLNGMTHSLKQVSLQV